MTALTKDAQKSNLIQLVHLNPGQLLSPIALGDKSNLPRTSGPRSSPFRPGPLRQSTAPKPAQPSSQRIAVYSDEQRPTARRSTTQVGLSLDGLLGALPATPARRSASPAGPVRSTPFVRSGRGPLPFRMSLGDKSLSVFGVGLDEGATIVGNGMDNSSFILETFEEASPHEQGDDVAMALETVSAERVDGGVPTDAATQEASEEAEAAASTSAVGDGAALQNALVRLSFEGGSFSDPRPARAPVNSPASSPLRVSANPSVLPSPVFTRDLSPSPDQESLSSSPFPPRRPRPAVLPARASGPLPTEDDLGYFIATTGTESSEPDLTSDSSHAEDERRCRASAKEVGVVGGGNREAWDTRRRTARGRKKKGAQWMRRGEELKVTEGESADEILIGM